MKRYSSIFCFFTDRLRRCIIASCGLFLFSFGYYLQLVADIGLPPWQALNQGLAQHLPITFGQASILISVLIVFTDILLKEAIGLGTILDAFIVGWGADFFIWLDLIPHQKNFWYGILVQIAALVIMSFAVSIQMKAALSCGPRDALMVAIGKRLPRVSIGTISISVSLIVLLIGFLLGGSVGAGTVINLVLSGIILDFVFNLIHFEPRAVVHENLLQTCSEFIRVVRA